MSNYRMANRIVLTPQEVTFFLARPYEYAAKAFRKAFYETQMADDLGLTDLNDGTYSYSQLRSSCFLFLPTFPLLILLF